MSSKLILFLVYVYFRQVFGLAINDTRVHYGKPIDVQEVFYQAALMYNDYEHLCGGSILTGKHILTAAHCVEYRDIQKMLIRVYSNGPTESGVFVNIAQIFMHPQYSGKPTPVYDVAVVVLKYDISFDPRVRSIKLPTRQPDVGTVVLATGWGETETSIIPSEVLLAVESTIAPVQECRKYAQPHQTYFCTTISKSGVCHGDFGGPLVDLAREEIVGISSFVAPNCRGNTGAYGSYFSNVYFLRPFIDGIIQQGQNSTEH